MKINLLESSSATKVKAPIKGSIQMKAKKKIEIEDATHELALRRGDIFYLSNSPKGIFLFDFDEELNKYWKFKITRNKFNQLKRDHKILSEDAATGTKKPTRKPSPKKVAQDNSADLAKLAAIALFGANTRTSMTKKNVQILSNLAATEEFLKTLKPGQRYPFNLNDLIKDLVSLLESKKLGFVSSIKSKYGIDFASPAFSTDGWKQGTAFKSRGGTFGDGRMIRVTPKQAASMLKSGKQTPLAITSIFEPKQPTRFSLDLIRNAQTSGDVELGDYDVPARKETITRDPTTRKPRPSRKGQSAGRFSKGKGQLYLKITNSKRLPSSYSIGNTSFSVEYNTSAAIAKKVAKAISTNSLSSLTSKPTPDFEKGEVGSFTFVNKGASRGGRVSTQDINVNAGRNANNQLVIEVTRVG
tara:strand:+ start:55480 stop:56721 length:1242 start_codon:yes stop_codon:yes gene_type:complete